MQPATHSLNHRFHMEPIRDAILYYDELSDEERAALHEELSDAPEWAAAFQRWLDIRQAVRTRMEAAWPDRHLLVLYAVAEQWGPDPLTEEEREALAAARSDIEQARAAHPAIDDVIAHIQDEGLAFEAEWGAHVAAGTTASASAPRADDRPPAPGSAREPTARMLSRIAIGGLVVMLAVGVLFLIPSEPTEPTVVETSADEQTEVILSEDVTVRLAETSRLSYAEDEAHRPTLEAGGAYFDVSPGTDVFVVETPTARTTVVGTQFGLQADADETQVVLAEGQVDVSSLEDPEATVTLEPGQQSRAAVGEAPTRPEPVDLTDALAWTGLFIFRDQSLETITERLAEHYDVRIEAADALRDESVTGTFEQDQPVEEILDVIASTLGAEVLQPAPETYRLEKE